LEFKHQTINKDSQDVEVASWFKGNPFGDKTNLLVSGVLPTCCSRFASEVYEEFEDNKGVIRIGISKRNRQHDGQKKKYKRTNNDLQNIHIKLKIE
jgi:hypothetical protein